MSGENTVSSDEKAQGAGFWAVMTTIAPPCQMSEHDACDEMTAEFLADHPEAAPWDCRCLCHMSRYLAERDRARSIAVALEQELARKDQALDEIRAALRVYWAAPAANEIERILAALDAHLNKEDDDQ